MLSIDRQDRPEYFVGLSTENSELVGLSSTKEQIPNSIKWWRYNREIYPNLSRMAFDLFAIPVMPAACERAFSKASYTNAARRSNLSLDIL